MKRTANMRKRRMITKKICKHEVCWRKVKMSSGRRVISRRARQWMKKSQSSITVECGKQSQLEIKRSH